MNGCGMKRSQGGTVMWILILLMLAVVGYLAWQKFAPDAA